MDQTQHRSLTFLGIQELNSYASVLGAPPNLDHLGRTTIKKDYSSNKVHAEIKKEV
jgi:hypothetical protein